MRSADERPAGTSPPSLAKPCLPAPAEGSRPVFPAPHPSFQTTDPRPKILPIRRQGWERGFSTASLELYDAPKICQLGQIMFGWKKNNAKPFDELW